MVFFPDAPRFVPFFSRHVCLLSFGAEWPVLHVSLAAASARSEMAPTGSPWIRGGAHARYPPCQFTRYSEFSTGRASGTHFRTAAASGTQPPPRRNRLAHIPSG